MGVKVGLALQSQEGVDWQELESLAVETEELGFESFWLSDHLTSVVGIGERSGLDTWAALTRVATITERLRFGSMMSPITWRHPSVLALTAASLDVLSEGRVELGIGAGWFADEHRAFGVPMPSMKTRFDMLEEAAEVIKLLWSGEQVSFAGRHFSLEGACGHPRPLQDPNPPLVIGGTGEKRTLPIVARYADEWNTVGMTPAECLAKRAVLDRCCHEVGRDPAEITHSVAAVLAIGEDEAAVRARVARIRQVFPLSFQFPPELAPFEPATLRENGWLAGTPEQLVELIEGLGDAGVTRVVLNVFDSEDRESVRHFAETVLPAFEAEPTL